eukprot:scaffold697_cov123-Skeletonema_marinoi.AAC.2
MDLDESAHSSLGSPVSAAAERSGDMKSDAMSSSGEPPTAASQQPPRPGIMRSFLSVKCKKPRAQCLKSLMNYN